MTASGSWGRQRRVAGKAEFTNEGSNPRFVVTSLKRAQCDTRYLYEKLYCAGGEMENLYQGVPARFVCGSHCEATMRANQLRVWLASFAYVLLCGLRRIALHHTSSPRQRAAPFAPKLLKIGALVRISVRRIKVAMGSGCPAAAIRGRAAIRLNAAASARASPA